MLHYIKGDLFSHSTTQIPILAHACNPFGLWGGGIAAQFRKRYPSAYRAYADHCSENGPSLLGKALMIPTKHNGADLYIACLFTSNFENSPSEIVQYTRLSMADLSNQVKQLAGLETADGLTVVNMPMINSGIFNVPWKDTEAALDECPLYINVYTI